jgi:hypothetical protein
MLAVTAALTATPVGSVSALTADEPASVRFREGFDDDRLPRCG